MDVFRNSTAEVRRLSGGKQEPRISEMSIAKRLFLAGSGAQLDSVSPQVTGVALQADPEQKVWGLAKRLDTVVAYQAYRRRDPNGRYVEAAGVALDGLQPPPSPNNTGPTTQLASASLSSDTSTL
jgi:hypothetical protein